MVSASKETDPLISITPDSHKFVHYHLIRVYINHARAEIARVGILYTLFQKQEENHLHQQRGKNRYKQVQLIMISKYILPRSNIHRRRISEIF